MLQPRLSPRHALLVCLVLLSVISQPAAANVAVPVVFTDHMVLQRDRALPVWGWADAGEKVTVTIGGQSKSATADADGKWSVTLDPLAVNREGLTLTIKGNNELTIQDVLVGEVWICSGQSNMQWPVSQSWNADLSVATAKHAQIRLLTNENAGVQKPLVDFVGSWQVCSPQTISDFSAVGYYFGQQLHEVLDVPVGLIDNAWGGSACEAWIQRERMAANSDWYGPLLKKWEMTEAQSDMKEPYDAYEAAILKWQADAIAAKKAGQAAPPQPDRPNSPMVQQHRPENLFNGRVVPLVPFAIRGVIWYQGETNAGRAYQYRDMFPLMVRNWRDAWKQGDFSFYWVQLADFQNENPQPGDSAWAELREAQTLSQDVLPHSGQAVIIDIGESSDIHPRNKLEVGKRLARLALAQDYGIDIVHQSPRFEAMEVKDGKASLSFAHRGSGLRTVDKREVLGFAIAGEDHQWQVAQAKIEDDGRITVWCDAVPKPVAVRYAWADNPVCNLYNNEGLPVTPFRTDTWPGVTAESRQ